MLLLTIRTDNSTAEVGLYDGQVKLVYYSWPAHRQLAETLHLKIRDLLKSKDYQLHDLNGIIVYQGPGSFTGLRIGLSVANALAYSLTVPIVGATGDKWLEKGRVAIGQGADDQIVLPTYGSPPHITKPRK